MKPNDYQDTYKALLDNTPVLKEAFEAAGIPIRPQDDVETSKVAALVYAHGRIEDLIRRVSKLETEVRALQGYAEDLYSKLNNLQK